MGRSYSERQEPSTTRLRDSSTCMKLPGGRIGIHREVLRADVAVSEFAVRELREVGDGNEAPLLDHASEIGSAFFVEARIHAHGHLDGRQSSERIGDVRLRRRHQPEIGGHVVHVDAVPGHQLAEIAPVNHRESVETVNAGQNSLGLDVGEAAGRNGEFFVAIALGDARAGVLHIAHGEAKFFTQRAKTFSRG